MNQFDIFNEMKIIAHLPKNVSQQLRIFKVWNVESKFQNLKKNANPTTNMNDT